MINYIINLNKNKDTIYQFYASKIVHEFNKCFIHVDFEFEVSDFLTVLTYEDIFDSVDIFHHPSSLGKTDYHLAQQHFVGIAFKKDEFVLQFEFVPGICKKNLKFTIE